MGDNDSGYHHKHKINHPAPNTCDTPTPMSVNVGIGSEPGLGLLSMQPLNADPHQGGPKSNVHMPIDRRPPRGDPSSITPPHGYPHREAADPGPRESAYGKVPHHGR